MRHDRLQFFLPLPRALIAALTQLAGLLQGAAHGLLIGEAQLGIDHLDISNGIDPARDMRDIVVSETAYHLQNGLCFADIGQKPIAQALTFRGALDQAGDINKLHMGRRLFFRPDQIGQLPKARIGHRHHADMRVNRAKGIIFSGDGRAGQRVKERRFTHIGQAHDTALKTH